MESVYINRGNSSNISTYHRSNNGPRSDYVHGGDDGVITGSGNRTINDSSDFIDDDGDGYFLGGRKNKTISSRGKEKGGHSRREKIF